MPAKPRVLYVVAKGRSGSNILAHALGQLDGYANTGELYHLWRSGYGERTRCGCGQPVPECALWSRVAATEAFAGVDPQQVARWQDEVLSWKAVPRMLRLRAGQPTRWEAFDRYVEIRSRLYQAIAELEGARVIVDASKWPWDPVLYGFVAGVDVSALYLIRDPRAVAYSWTRTKSLQDRADQPRNMPRFAAGYSALSWLARNTVTEMTHRRRPTLPWLVVRYEDFVGQPAEAIGRIANFADAPADAPFVDDHTLHMEPTHNVGGNASKFSVGDVRLHLDDEWERALPPSARRVTTTLTAPLLRRYGYPLRVEA